MESDHTIGFERKYLGLWQVYKHSEFLHYDNGSGQNVSSESLQERPISECGGLWIYVILSFFISFSGHVKNYVYHRAKSKVCIIKKYKMLHLVVFSLIELSGYSTKIV